MKYKKKIQNQVQCKVDGFAIKPFIDFLAPLGHRNKILRGIKALQDSSMPTSNIQAGKQCSIISVER